MHESPNPLVSAPDTNVGVQSDRLTSIRDSRLVVLPTTEVETINAGLPIKGQRNRGTGAPASTPSGANTYRSTLARAGARRHHEKMTFR
jgi:hypothetical protein